MKICGLEFMEKKNADWKYLTRKKVLNIEKNLIVLTCKKEVYPKQSYLPIFIQGVIQMIFFYLFSYVLQTNIKKDVGYDCV